MKIPEVPVEKALSMSFPDVLAGLRPHVLLEVPQGATGDASFMLEVDSLIAHFANLYAYLQMLYAYAASEVSRLQAAGAKEEASVVIMKRDVFYRLGRGVEMKHAACSRLVTVSLGNEPFDTAPHGARRGGWSRVESATR